MTKRSNVDKVKVENGHPKYPCADKHAGRIILPLPLTQEVNIVKYITSSSSNYTFSLLAILKFFHILVRNGPEKKLSKFGAIFFLICPPPNTD